MPTIRVTPDSAMLLLLTAITATTCGVGSLGVANYLRGELAQAAISIVVPAFLAYWVWHDRDTTGSSRPLIGLLMAARLAGMPLGWAVTRLVA